MKYLPTLGGAVAMATVIAGGLVWAVDTRYDARRALENIEQHDQLSGHTDTVVGLAEIGRSIEALSESLGQLREVQVRIEARVYDLQVLMAPDPRSELVAPF